MTGIPAAAPPAGLDSAAVPSLGEALRVWAKIGVLSFGGPAGQIALMHRVLVDEKRWIDEPRFLSALNFCMLLPGPEAMQLATYVGWRMHGVRGGLAAGLLFVLPGAVVILALSMLYAGLGRLPAAQALFVGIQAAVFAIVIEALLRVARRALRGRLDWIIAAAAFLAIFFFKVPFPLIVIAAALLGVWRGAGAIQAEPAPLSSAAFVSKLQTGRTVVVWLAIWVVPLVAVAGIVGGGHVLAETGWFFSKLAVVTFGGAYAVLAYMAQDVVQHYRWLSPAEMLDGLGLAETTPGPLILVTEFVGFLAAFREGGGNSWAMGVLGAVVTLWATFAPCFLWIFAGAPYIERVNAEPRLKSALAAVTAAVVGVILNLTVWFGLHVLFAGIREVQMRPLVLLVPDPSSLNVKALLLAAVAFLLLFVLHRGVVATLAVCSALAVAAFAAQL
jgi:chromate transporter